MFYDEMGISSPRAIVGWTWTAVGLIVTAYSLAAYAARVQQTQAAGAADEAGQQGAFRLKESQGSNDGLTQLASAENAGVVSDTDPPPGVETIVVHGNAHKGLFETLFPPFLNRTLGRFGDGLKDAFIGVSHIIGGVGSGAMFLITSPVIGGLGALTGQPGILPRMFGESFRMAEFGGRMVGAGLQRSASGLTGGYVHIPTDPAMPPNRFEP